MRTEFGSASQLDRSLENVLPLRASAGPYMVIPRMVHADDKLIAA